MRRGKFSVRDYLRFAFLVLLPLSGLMHLLMAEWMGDRRPDWLAAVAAGANFVAAVAVLIVGSGRVRRIVPVFAASAAVALEVAVFVFGVAYLLREMASGIGGLALLLVFGPLWFMLCLLRGGVALGMGVFAVTWRGPA